MQSPTPAVAMAASVGRAAGSEWPDISAVCCVCAWPEAPRPADGGPAAPPGREHPEMGRGMESDRSAAQRTAPSRQRIGPRRGRADSRPWAGELVGPRAGAGSARCDLSSCPAGHPPRGPGPRRSTAGSHPARVASRRSGPEPPPPVTSLPRSPHAVLSPRPWEWVWCQRLSDARRNTCKATPWWCLMNGKHFLTTRKRKTTFTNPQTC